MKHCTLAGSQGITKDTDLRAYNLCQSGNINHKAVKEIHII